MYRLKSNTYAHIPLTYGSNDLGTIFTACANSPLVQWPLSRPNDIPMRFSTSMSSWISNVRSKLNKYSDLNNAHQHACTVFEPTPLVFATFSVMHSQNESSHYCHDVCLPSVCLSGTGMHCDHTVQFSEDLSLWLDSPMFWALSHQCRLTYLHRLFRVPPGREVG